MKRIKCITRCTMAGLFLLGLVAVAGCTGHKVQVQTYPPENIIHVDQLRMRSDMQRLNTLVFYVDKGDTIPLALSMDSEIIAFKQEQIDLVAKQRLYFRVCVPDHLSENELSELGQIDARTLNHWSEKRRSEFLKKYTLYISKDAVRWAPFSSISALREVLGYNEGRVAFSMAAGLDHGVGASLSVKTVR